MTYHNKRKKVGILMGLFSKKQKSSSLSIFTINKEEKTDSDVIIEEEEKGGLDSAALKEEALNIQETPVSESEVESEKFIEPTNTLPTEQDDGISTTQDVGGMVENHQYIYTIKEDKTCVLHKIKMSEKTLVIPERIDGYLVDEINSLDNKAIYDTKELHIVEVVLPDSVRKIGACSFYGCKDIETIQMPSQLEELGTSAFAYCLALQEITLGPSMRFIQENCFKCCTNLSIISIYSVNCEIPEPMSTFDTKNKATVIYGFLDSIVEHSIVNARLNFKELTILKIQADYVGNSLEMNEEVKKDNVVVYRVWSNYKTEQIFDFVIQNTSFSESGTQKVLVTYEYEDKYFESTFSIFVKGKILESIIAKYIGEPVIRKTKLLKNDIQVFAKFNDESMEEISDFIIDNEMIHNIGSNVVTIIYDSQITECIVPGIKESVVYLEVTFLNKEFRLNDELTTEDFRVIAHYDNHTSNELHDFKLDKTSFEQEGSNLVEIQVEEYNQIYEIHVLPYKQISITEFLQALEEKQLCTISENNNPVAIPNGMIGLTIQKKSNSEYIINYEEDGLQSKTITI